MPARKLKQFLDSEKVKYITCTHSQFFTASEIAASAHIPGKQLAKTVMINVDGDIAMAVLPATDRVDLPLLREVTGSGKTRLATEREFKDLFPDCEIGAMPPFGNLYGMEVYVSSSLTEDEEIAFNAGSHTELIKLSYADFERLVRPRVVDLTIAV